MARPPLRKASFIDPMLILRTSKSPEGAEGPHGLKLDCYRALAINGGGVVEGRWIEVTATSVMEAACHYFGMVSSLIVSNVPRPHPNVIFSVQVDSRVYRVTFERMMQWANAKAEKSARRKSG